MKHKNGFTLIELLVVVALISLLSSIVFASLNSARAKARDAQRAAAVRQVQIALELYYDANGYYAPDTDSAGGGGGNGDLPFTDPMLTAALTPTYISKLPTDPNNPFNYHYYNAKLNPAIFYAIYMPYEKKAACFVCAGSSTYCISSQTWWGVNMC